jgi:hypothetical protein
MKLLQHTYILLSIVAVMVVVQLAKISRTKDTVTLIRASEKTIVITDASLEDAAPAAYYSKRDNSWSFSAKVVEIKDVSIYGRVTLPAEPPDLAADNCGVASAIFSPRLWNDRLLAPTGFCSILDDPATPPSICLDPRSIALPSQPATFVFTWEYPHSWTGLRCE